MVLASRHTTGLCWTAETTRGQLGDCDLSLDKASKHGHLHHKVFNVQNAEMCLTCCHPKTEPFKEARVPFIRCVEMGGLLNYFFLTMCQNVDKRCPILFTSTDLVSSQVSDLDDLHSELHEQRLQDHTLVLPVLLAHGLLPLRHTFLENTHRAHSEAAFLYDNSVVLWETRNKI